MDVLLWQNNVNFHDNQKQTKSTMKIKEMIVVNKDNAPDISDEIISWSVRSYRTKNISSLK